MTTTDINLTENLMPREEALRILLDAAHQFVHPLGDGVRGTSFTAEGRFEFIEVLHVVLGDLAYVMGELALLDPTDDDEDIESLWEVESAIRSAAEYFDKDIIPRHRAA